jgi:hypothetical protein
VGLLVLAEQARWLRLGVVAALWAALVGAFAAARYRRELLGHPDRADELQRVYELELEREVSARREYELGVEMSTRRKVEQEVRNEVRGELEGLRAELQTLRQNLEVLMGGEVLVQRVALRAESARLPSLPDQACAARSADWALPRGRGDHPVPQAQAGNPTDVLPRYREGPSGSEPAALHDRRQPAAQRERRPQESRTGRWRIPREEPARLPVRRHHPEPASDPLGVDQLVAEQGAAAEQLPPAAAWEQFDSWVSANPSRPEGNGTGGRRRRPEPQASNEETAEPGGTIEPRRRHRREA